MAESLGTSSLLSKIGEYEEILAKSPGSDVFVHLAEAYRKMGLLEEASGAIEKGLEHHPSMTAAHVTRGRIRAQQGDLDGAVYAFESALEHESNNASALKGLARVRLMQNATDAAIPIVKQLLQLRADDPEVAKLKAMCESQSSAAKKDADKASGAPIKTVTMVDIYIKQGLLEDARTLCLEILKDDPTNEVTQAKAQQIDQLIQEASSPAAMVEEPQSDSIVIDEKPTQTTESNKSAIEILEGWLAAINKRRSHV